MRGVIMYYLLKTGEKEYKCVLSAAACVELEKRLNGKNPLSIFMTGVPTITDMLAVLHASLQKYQHSISMEDAFDIYDAYVADGHTFNEFSAVIIGIFKESGFMADDEKNA